MANKYDITQYSNAFTLSWEEDENGNEVLEWYEDPEQEFGFSEIVKDFGWKSIPSEALRRSKEDQINSPIYWIGEVIEEVVDEANKRSEENHYNYHFDPEQGAGIEEIGFWFTETVIKLKGGK